MQAKLNAGKQVAACSTLLVIKFHMKGEILDSPHCAVIQNQIKDEVVFDNRLKTVLMLKEK